MNLKEQTVYIPDDKRTTGIYHSLKQSIPVREQKQLICISKEELIELLGNVWDNSIERSNYDNECDCDKCGYCISVKPNLPIPPTKEQFINTILAV